MRGKPLFRYFLIFDLIDFTHHEVRINIGCILRLYSIIILNKYITSKLIYFEISEIIIKLKFHKNGTAAAANDGVYVERYTYNIFFITFILSPM